MFTELLQSPKTPWTGGSAGDPAPWSVEITRDNLSSQGLTLLLVDASPGRWGDVVQRVQLPGSALPPSTPAIHLASAPWPAEVPSFVWSDSEASGESPSLTRPRSLILLEGIHDFLLGANLLTSSAQRQIWGQAELLDMLTLADPGVLGLALDWNRASVLQAIGLDLTDFAAIETAPGTVAIGSGNHGLRDAVSGVPDPDTGVLVQGDWVYTISPGMANPEPRLLANLDQASPEIPEPALVSAWLLLVSGLAWRIRSVDQPA